MVHPDQPLEQDRLALFDRLAELTRRPDDEFAELRTRYHGDKRLTVPATVFNAVLQRTETV